MSTSKFALALILAGGMLNAPAAAIARDSVEAVVSPSAVSPLFQLKLIPGRMDEERGLGTLQVQLTVSNLKVAAGAPLLSMPVFASNNDTAARTLFDLQARDDRGVVELVSEDDPPAATQLRRWTATRAVEGDLRVSYRARIDNTPGQTAPPIVLRTEAGGLSGVGRTFIMLPENPELYRLSLSWDLSALDAGATASSSFGDGDVEAPVGSVSQIYRSMFMAGVLSREPVTVTDQGFSAVWLGETTMPDVRPTMEWTHTLYDWMSGFFQDERIRPYRVFLRYNPLNAGGGLGLNNSFIATYKEGSSGHGLKNTLAHEMIHTWTGLNSPGAWYHEGNAVYLDGLLPWRAGLISTEEFLEDLNTTARRYYTNALINTPDEEIAPRFWEDTRIRTLPYDRGAFYFAVLNGKITRASGGRRQVDDLIIEMMRRGDKGQPVTEAAWVDLLVRELGEEGRAIHQSMMAGGVMLPESGDFGPCFRRTEKVFRRFELGYDPRSLAGTEKVIRGLIPGSEAERAGIREGDVVSMSSGLDHIQGSQTLTLTLGVTRDGRTFDVTYLPRGEETTAYQWERIAEVPENRCLY